jgi:hypothetical protein
MVADIDAATDHVHLLFYIWLPDNNGCKIADALMRAAQRGVTCRAMADDLGSRLMIRSEHWRRMQAAGVRWPARCPSAIRCCACWRAHRPAQPPQDRRHRRLDHLLRQPELRRPGVPRQGQVRPLGGRDDALRGPHRAPESAPVRRRLDGHVGRRHDDLLRPARCPRSKSNRA